MAHRILRLALVAAILAVPSPAAFAQAKVYPPGTDCANLPTIAERLLCGRQEFRRQSGTVTQQQPAETPPPPLGNGLPESRVPPTVAPPTMNAVAPDRSGANTNH